MYHVRTFSPISNHALDSDKLPTLIKVLNFGTNETLDKPVVINDKSLRVFGETQKKIGRERIALDYDHNTVPGTEAYLNDKNPRNIAAYGTPILTKEGLFLKDIKWTPSGKQSALNYEDLSPAAILDEDGVLIGVHSVALTPAGAVKNLTFYSADISLKNMKTMAIDDRQALKESNDLVEHEKSELGINSADKDVNRTGMVFNAECDDKMEKDDEMDGDDIHHTVKHYGGQVHMGAAPDWTKEEHMAHAEKVKSMDSEDHYSEYGDVNYADKANHKYPLDTEKHVRAAWSYINMPKNARKYDSKKLSTIKNNIRAAMKKHDIGESGETKAMSASMPDAYLNIEPKESTQTKQYMIETLKKIAPEKLGMKTDAEVLEILKQLVAKWDGVDGVQGPITNKENSSVHEFSADIKSLQDKIAALEAKSQAEVTRHAETEKQEIVAQASREGKVIPLSAESIKSTSVSMLREIVDKLPKDKVPMKTTLRPLSAEGKSNTKVTIADSARLIDEQIASFKL